METTPHILVVDDDPAWRDLLAFRLRQHGVEATAAGSVAAAIDELERSSVDLVLTDHRMPGATGLDLLAYVRARHPEIPVIVMSALLDGGLVEEAFAGGAAGVHEKGALTAVPQLAVLACAA